MPSILALSAHPPHPPLTGMKNNTRETERAPKASRSSQFPHSPQRSPLSVVLPVTGINFNTRVTGSTGVSVVRDIPSDMAEAYEQYRVALSTHNRLLGRLSEMLGCGCKLTSYTSRHSWATAARNHNVPISVISQGMDHTSEQTSQIYLTMLENSVIDDANRGIIEHLD